MRRLFSPASILPLLIILVGLVGAFGLPQKIGISTEQLLLGLFATIGLGLLIERMGILTAIRDTQMELKNALRPSISADSLFLTRSDPPAFDSIIAGAHEMWVAGKSLNSLLAANGSAVLDSGVKFRFLTHDPSVAHLTHSMASQSFSNPSVNDIESGIRSGITQLARLVTAAPSRIEVRLSTALMPCGFTIVNPGDRDEWMRVELFSFRISLGARRSIILSKEREPKIYSFFFEQFMNLWTSSAPLHLSAQEGNMMTRAINE